MGFKFVLLAFLIPFYTLSVEASSFSFGKLIGFDRPGKDKAPNAPATPGSSQTQPGQSNAPPASGPSQIQPGKENVSNATAPSGPSQIPAQIKAAIVEEKAIVVEEEKRDDAADAAEHADALKALGGVLAELSEQIESPQTSPDKGDSGKKDTPLPVDEPPLPPLPVDPDEWGEVELERVKELTKTITQGQIDYAIDTYLEELDLPKTDKFRGAFIAAGGLANPPTEGAIIAAKFGLPFDDEDLNDAMDDLYEASEGEIVLTRKHYDLIKALRTHKESKFLLDITGLALTLDWAGRGLGTVPHSGLIYMGSMPLGNEKKPTDPHIFAIYPISGDLFGLKTFKLDGFNKEMNFIVISDPMLANLKQKGNIKRLFFVENLAVLETSDELNVAGKPIPTTHIAKNLFKSAIIIGK